MGEPKFDEIDFYGKDELLQISHRPEPGSWMKTPVNMKLGNFIYPTKAKHLEYQGLPNPREWVVTEDDWKLPGNWPNGPVAMIC